MLFHKYSHEFIHLKAVFRVKVFIDMCLCFLWEDKVTDLHQAILGNAFNLIALVSLHVNSGH